MVDIKEYPIHTIFKEQFGIEEMDYNEDILFNDDKKEYTYKSYGIKMPLMREILDKLKEK